MELTAVIKNKAAESSGSSAVEFALVFPLFLILFFGIVEFSWYMTQKALLSYATNQGARVSSMASATLTDAELQSLVAVEVLQSYYGALALDVFDIQVDILPATETSTPSGSGSVTLPRRVRVIVFRLPYNPIAGFLSKDVIPASITAKAIGVLQ